MIVHPMQRGVGKHTIKFLREANLTRVHGVKRQISKFAMWKCLFRKLDHLRRSINADG